jgi:hypothetical protein
MRGGAKERWCGAPPNRRVIGSRVMETDRSAGAVARAWARTMAVPRSIISLRM